jgi:hypothetical protein
LEDFAQQLRGRAQWLAAEQNVEFNRAKLNNVLSASHQVPHAHAHAAATDADTFFCNRVLGSVPHGLGALGCEGEEPATSPMLADGGMESASLVEHQLQRVTPGTGGALEAPVKERPVAAERPTRPPRQTTLQRKLPNV